MQSFKQIPYQNYIQLKFNQKNLKEAAENELIMKYKRNAQLLAQIFTFRQVSNQSEKEQIPDAKISEELLESYQKSIQQGRISAMRDVEQLKGKLDKFQEMSGQIEKISSKQQVVNLIEGLKSNGMYDQYHPFFIEDSPFYLNGTEKNCMEIELNQEEYDDSGSHFIELN